MVEESSPLLPYAEESIEAGTDTALESEPESGEPTPEPGSESGFVCDCEAWMRSACKGLFFYKEHESRRYCVLHYPGKEKSADFKAALDSKLNNKDFDFRGVWFPDEVDLQGFEFSAAADFSFATFSAAAYFLSATFSTAADFSYATFSADAFFFSATFSAAAKFTSATFSAAAHFSSATFSANADFRSATFSANADFSSTFSANAYFTSATFRADAKFDHATFSANADFSSATFSADADFSYALFHGTADFMRASFDDSLSFFGSTTERHLTEKTTLDSGVVGKDPALDFQHARIEKPGQVSFHTLALRPHWFVNVDSRQFVFTDVRWELDRIRIKQEIAALERKKVSSPNRLLAIACRQLAENSEANNRYEEASRFRYWAMDLARRSKWKRWAFWKTDWLHILYGLVSGYGERILRALGVLAAVWIVFALLYTLVGFVRTEDKSAMQPYPDTTGQPLPIKRAFTYSLAVISLQKPEPRPLTNWAHTVVTLETILGPVQAALLALAIRRKFMR